MFQNKVEFFLAESCAPDLRGKLLGEGAIILDSLDPKGRGLALVGNSYLQAPYPIEGAVAIILEAWAFISLSKGYPVALNPFFTSKNYFALAEPPLRIRDECQDCLARNIEHDEWEGFPSDSEEEEEIKQKRKRFRKETENLIKFVDKNKDSPFDEIFKKASKHFEGRSERGLKAEFIGAFQKFLKTKAEA